MLNFLKKLFGLSPATVSEEELLDINVCPNCWGKQTYDGQFEEYVKDPTRSNIAKDHGHRKAFIQQFVEDRVSGIKLINEGALKTCPGCKTKYQPKN